MITRVLWTCLGRKSLSKVILRNVNQFRLRKISTLFQTRNFVSDIHEHEENLDFVSSDLVVKETMYAGSTDKIILEMKQCNSFEEISKFIDNIASLEKDQACQLILTLSDIVRNLETVPVLNIESIVVRFDQILDQMTIEEISVCFHYLSKLGINVKQPIMERMSDKIIEEIKKQNNFSLTYLSHFTVGLNTDKGLYSSILAVATIPQISKQLNECSNVNDLYLLTICLTNISNIISLNLLDDFKSKVEEFLDKELLNETSSKCLLKVTNFLNYPHWSFRNTALIRRILIELQDNIKFFETRNLVTINRAFQSQLESASLVPLLVKRAQELLTESPNVELLSLAVLHITPDRRLKIAEMLRKFLSTYQISSAQSGETLQTVFKILRLLKISDINLCDDYWTKVLNEIYSTKESNLNYRLSKHIQKYMFFNNNLGGTYRHIEFETSMIEMLMLELKSPQFPKDFAKFASFIIAYGDGSGEMRLPQFIVNKIENLHEQFTVKDCLQLSRGVQILTEVRLRRQMNADLENQIDSINFSLGKCAKRHMKKGELHITELNAIIRAFVNRKALKDNFVFHKMINHFNTNKKLELNSRSIRDIAYNLTFCNYRMDPICDQFIEYILDNWEHVTGDTVEKILTCCYNFSYFPEKPEVFERSSEIIIRDFNYMSGLSIVQALLALIFYKSCPQQLIAIVFSSEFIKRLEQEIAMCYSKNTYPQRVMNQVMQLNRAVCLDCPEVNVKWFQQSYMEAQATKFPLIQSRLHKDVKSVLLEIVRQPDFLKINRVTPYGYRVDFELNMDQYNRFIQPQPEDFHNINYSQNVNKIAVLLLSRKMLCDNDINRLKGSELLRMRHLEMLGYRVIHVKIHDFNAMFKNVSAKINYIKSLLQLTA